jgi:hypothetical protein
MPEEQVVTIVIPKTRFSQFRHTNPNLRWGQEFHQFMGLEKITSDPNKIWCDRLYNEPNAARARAMVLQQIDVEN